MEKLRPLSNSSDTVAKRKSITGSHQNKIAWSIKNEGYNNPASPSLIPYTDTYPREAAFVFSINRSINIYKLPSLINALT